MDITQIARYKRSVAAVWDLHNLVFQNINISHSLKECSGAGTSDISKYLSGTGFPVIKPVLNYSDYSGHKLWKVFVQKKV